MCVPRVYNARDALTGDCEYVIKTKSTQQLMKVRVIQNQITGFLVGNRFAESHTKVPIGMTVHKAFFALAGQTQFEPPEIVLKHQMEVIQIQNMHNDQ